MFLTINQKANGKQIRSKPKANGKQNDIKKTSKRYQHLYRLAKERIKHPCTIYTKNLYIVKICCYNNRIGISTIIPKIININSAECRGKDGKMGMGNMMMAVSAEKELFMRDIARKASSNILMRGKNWSRFAKYQGVRRIKYQTSLTNEEASELEALRKILCPNYSRYAFIRLLLSEFIEVASSMVRQIDRGCCVDG